MAGDEPATCDCAGTGVVAARLMVVAAIELVDAALEELLAASGALAELLPPAMTVAAWVAKVDGWLIDPIAGMSWNGAA